ncbi:ATP-binding protein [Streptomyces sp. H27-D2]|uniref:ATP-binding protein n=1 Tax=Streptomyces sp. H27-D2 TaxID=3046304 RepID=UPI002DB67BAC|nr:ATP-binding protein [Streptomyces sp. H27-D2]MEC4018128.1 ATP-binding protein [Streptomyces sp. H27-D2]
MCQYVVPRKAWELHFLAEPEEVSALRRITRLRLEAWGLHNLIDAAQLCLSELVANVITHVGRGTPTTLGVSMNGTHLRIEVRDPDGRVLPVLLSATATSESGRGLGLVTAMTDRWGVIPTDSGKTTWCEIATGLTAANSAAGGARVAKAEALLTLYRCEAVIGPVAKGPVSLAVAEGAAVDLIADVLHWLRAHGRDPDEILDRAQMHYEAEAAG